MVTENVCTLCVLRCAAYHCYVMRIIGAKSDTRNSYQLLLVRRCYYAILYDVYSIVAKALHSCEADRKPRLRVKFLLLLLLLGSRCFY
jgi:hypothetical protein